MATTEKIQTSPKLAPPGAGIPFHQKLFLRFWIRPFMAQKTTWEQSQKIFSTTTEKILKELEGLSEAQMNQKVLVPPIQGLEDSSRFWSMAMTLEHLVIAGRGISLVVEALTHDITPVAKADIARLKPFGQMSPFESIENFKKFAFEEYPKIKIGNRSSKLKFLHPWFGPMTAQAWYWLLGGHQMIHLKQIREIKKGLQ